MRVAEIMMTDVKCVSPDQTVADAVVTLADAHVHGVPVVDQHGKVVGVLATSDVLEALAEASDPDARERLLAETNVADLMTVGAHTIKPDDDIHEAAKHMLYLDVHRLFVEDGTGLVGVISQSDVVRAVATLRI